MAELQELVQAYENSFCISCVFVQAMATSQTFLEALKNPLEALITVSASALDPAHGQTADFQAQDVCNRKS